MKRAVTLALCARLIAASAMMVPLLGGCSGSETGNPSATARLRLGLRTTDSSVATVGEAGDAIRVKELWLSIASIAAVPCAGGAEQVPINRSLRPLGGWSAATNSPLPDVLLSSRDPTGHAVTDSVTSNRRRVDGWPFYAALSSGPLFACTHADETR